MGKLSQASLPPSLGTGKLEDSTPLQTLARASFFSKLNAEQLKLVASSAQMQRCDANSQIYTLGDPAEHLYVLVDGMVRFRLSLGNRHASAGEIIGRGDVFGWAAIIEDTQRRIASATCITPCVLIAINGTEFLDLMERHNDIGYRVMKQLSKLITSNMISFAAG